MLALRVNIIHYICNLELSNLFILISNRVSCYKVTSYWKAEVKKLHKKIQNLSGRFYCAQI